MGDVVIVAHPRLGLIVKRIAQLDPDGTIQLEGDSAASTSRAALGHVLRENIKGRAMVRVAPRAICRLPRAPRR